MLIIAKAVYFNIASTPLYWIIKVWKKADKKVCECAYKKVCKDLLEALL